MIHPLIPDSAITRNVLRNRVVELDAEERSVLEGAACEIRSYPAGHIAVRQAEPVRISTLLVQGFMTRHVDARDGRRHLVAVHVPGDFVDLHAYVLKELDHDVGALTDVTVAVFPHEAIERIQQTHATLTRRLWFLTMLDAAMHRQWIYRLASLTAVQRVAHFVCEMNARLMAIGQSDGVRFGLPMTQSDIGEVCGLTNVHVNRVLRELRESGLCTVRASSIEIFDLPGLAAMGGFNPHYLYLSGAMAGQALGSS
ncbi:MAG: Crp/Fnr family transcriptional regulator [Burkholderiales bacterium]|nr:MAG: Crp/Fnr family transcriptional regulator [Burkholderiales bacterium]